jgi:hypothetical protein
MVVEAISHNQNETDLSAVNNKSHRLGGFYNAVYIDFI